MNLNFGFIPIASQFIKTENELLKITGKYFLALENLGAKRWDEENLNNLNFLVYIIVTGGTERLLLNLLEKRWKFVKDEPVILIAHPTHNSLPASLEILAKLNQDGINGRIFYLSGESNTNDFEQIAFYIKNLNVKKQLANSRIGLIGEPSDWLVASSPDSFIIKEKWGPEVIKIKMDEIIESIKNIADEDINLSIDSHLTDAKITIEPTQKDLENNVRVYLALKEIINKYKLNAVTIRCFDLVLDIKTTGCFGLSQLNDDGYIAGCEGDLVSTVGMLWANKLLNQIPWMANPAQVDIKNNSLWLAHCTVPKSIVKNYNLRSHFESGIGVGIQGFVSNGPITLFRIGGKRMDKLWTAEGEIFQTGNSEHLCRTQVEIKLTNGRIKDLLENPLGNHLILLFGHHSFTLNNWWKLNIDEK
jgi:L-fucose isomerase-like protein